jgi:2-oxoglutarate ferredoxin oxidoreductase subunit beta
VFNLVPSDHDVTDELAAFKLAEAPFPGYFGIFYKSPRPTKNANEAKINTAAMEKVKGLKDWQVLQQTFNRMK